MHTHLKAKHYEQHHYITNYKFILQITITLQMTPMHYKQQLCITNNKYISHTKNIHYKKQATLQTTTIYHKQQVLMTHKN